MIRGTTTCNKTLLLKPSDLIEHFSKILEEANGKEVRAVLSQRVSSIPQRYEGNHLDQYKKNIQVINNYNKEGHNIILFESELEIFADVEVGYLFSKEARPKFHKAIKLATEKDAFLLAESTSRLVRNKYWTPRLHHLRPTTRELEDLREITQDVRMATFLHPDATSAEEKSYQTLRGLTMKQKDKIGIKATWLSMVMELHKNGISSIGIMREIICRGGPRIDYTTIARWIKQSTTKEIMSTLDRDKMRKAGVRISDF